MKRTLLIASLVGTFALGWSLGTRGTRTVDAAPKPTCKSDLTKAKADLAAANATIAAQDQQMKDMLETERRRVQALEERLNAKKTTGPSKPVQPKKLEPIQKLD